MIILQEGVAYQLWKGVSRLKSLIYMAYDSRKNLALRKEHLAFQALRIGGLIYEQPKRLRDEVLVVFHWWGAASPYPQKFYPLPNCFTMLTDQDCLLYHALSNIFRYARGCSSALNHKCLELGRLDLLINLYSL